MSVTLNVTKRAADQVADAHTIFGVVYGPKQENITIAMARTVFEKLFKEAGESTIITLAGLDAPIEVLVHDVSFNPTKGGITHVDFYAIERGKEMTTNVPLEFVGTAPVEKSGGMVSKILHEVEVTCRPSNLPSHIDVSLEVLTAVDGKIHVSDLVLPAGVVVTNDPEEVVALATGERDTAEEDEVSEVDMSAIAVEEKGKKETDEAAV